MKACRVMILMVLALAIALPTLCFADEREIDDVEYIGKKMEVDDSVGTLISEFGPPLYKDKITMKAGITGGIERDVKLWFYQLGGEYGIPKTSYKFMLVDGIVKAIYEIE